MSGSFRGDDEIRAALGRTRADIERTRADIEHTRAELAETVHALSAGRNEPKKTAGQPPAYRAQRGSGPMPVPVPRAIAKIAQGAKPVVAYAAGDTFRGAVFAAGVLWLLVVLGRRRHRR